MGFDCLLNFRPQLGCIAPVWKTVFPGNVFSQYDSSTRDTTVALKLYSYREALEKDAILSLLISAIPCPAFLQDDAARAGGRQVAGDKAVVVYGNELHCLGQN